MAGYIGSKASVVSSGAERKKVFTITTTTTSLTGLAYTPTKVHVFHNGIRLVDGTDYTATNGTSITLTNAAENGDEVVVVSYATFQVADAYTQAESDVRYVQVAGDTMTGALTGTDLTLSGGVYLGGTGSANKLDDYEFGTFSSSTSSNNVTSYGSFIGRYIKVGKMVHITAALSGIYAGTGHRYFVFNAPFPQYANSHISTGTCTAYPKGDRQSGIVINNSSADAYGFYVSWNNVSSQNGGAVSVSITYETSA